MKVSDQIKTRMEQLGITVPELARRAKCSPQSVRFWLAGRNMPRKRRAAALEHALSFSIDWTEGGATRGQPTAAALLNQSDVELMMKMSRLPVRVKIALAELADAIRDQAEEPVRSIRRETHGSIEPFAERTTARGKDAKKQHGRKAARKAA